MAIKVRRRAGSISASSGPRIRRPRRPTKAQVELLCRLISEGKGPIRSSGMAGIDVPAFRREYEASHDFRDRVDYASMVPDEQVRETIYLLGMSGNLAAAEAFLGLRMADLELRVLYDRHQVEMEAFERPASTASAATVLAGFFGEIADLIPADNHAEVLRRLMRAVEKTEADGEVPKSVAAASRPYWIDLDDLDDLAIGPEDLDDGPGIEGDEVGSEDGPGEDGLEGGSEDEGDWESSGIEA